MRAHAVEAVVEALDRIVAAEEPSISKHLTREFKKRGITAKTSTRVASVEADEHRAVVHLEGGDALEVDLVLVAVGRGPRSEGIGGEAGAVLHALTDRADVGGGSVGAQHRRLPAGERHGQAGHRWILRKLT